MSGLPSLTQLVFPYVEVAAFMVGINLYLLTRLFPRPVPSPSLDAVVLVVGFLIVGLGFWGAVLFAVADPGDAASIGLFLAINAMMAAVGCWMLALFFRAEEKRVTGAGWSWPLVLAGLFVGNELLMGVAYALALNGTGPYSAPGVAGFDAALGDGVVSVWFFGAMFVTMVALLYRLPLASAERRVLLGFSATSLVGPAVAIAPVAAACAMLGLMTAVVALLLWPLRGRSPLPGRYAWLLGGVFLGFGGMGAGELLSLAAPAVQGSAWPFAVATLCVMTGEFAVLARTGFALGEGRAEPSDSERSTPSPEARSRPSPG